jgi:hypothetical protein
MPLTTRKKQDPEQILECHTSFVQESPDDGTWITFHKGDRLRRGDVAEKVRGYENFFKADGTPDPAPVIALLPDHTDPHATRLLQPIPPGEAAVCTRKIITGWGGGVVVVKLGERIPKRHDLVKKFPDRFELEKS